MSPYKGGRTPEAGREGRGRQPLEARRRGSFDNPHGRRGLPPSLRDRQAKRQNPPSCGERGLRKLRRPMFASPCTRTRYRLIPYSARPRVGIFFLNSFYHSGAVLAHPHDAVCAHVSGPVTAWLCGEPTHGRIQRSRCRVHKNYWNSCEDG